MTRTPRSIVVLFALFATLFAQLGVSAYACPGTETAAQHESIPCEGMDAALPNLCDKHCHDAEQSPVAAMPAMAFFAAYVVSVPVPHAVTAKRIPPDLQHPSDPPPGLRHCRLQL
jgi:hypothetical protein